MATTPLTHHEIIGLVEPFTRSGRHVDLAASDRMARRLAFKPVEHAGDGAAVPALRELLQLENSHGSTWRLTRHLSLPGGLQASLTAEGSQPAELLARIETVPLQRQFSIGDGWVLAKSHKLEPQAGSHSSPTLILTLGVAVLDGLLMKLRVSSVKGISGEIELELTGEDTLDLPEDLLAVLGWDWARLVKARHGWNSRLRLHGAGAARSADAEAKLALGVRHLAQTLAEPPARFHDKQVGARWRVVLQRSMPLIGAAAMVGGAAAFPNLEVANDSILRMLVFHAPPIILVVLFCLNELPRVEIPPVPRRLTATSWRRPRAAPAAP